MIDEMAVLEVRHISKDYRISGENSLIAKTFHAVEDVSLSVRKGETFGIVGESGCGKSTLARLMVCLEKPTSGEVLFQGMRMDTMPEGQLRRVRPRFQMVFQDSGSSLNPRKRVQDILREPMLYHSGRTAGGNERPVSARFFRRTAPENLHCKGSFAQSGCDCPG